MLFFLQFGEIINETAINVFKMPFGAHIHAVCCLVYLRSGTVGSQINFTSVLKSGCTSLPTPLAFRRVPTSHAHQNLVVVVNLFLISTILMHLDSGVSRRFYFSYL